MEERDDYPIIPQEPNWVTKYNAATDRIGGKRGEIELDKLSKANIKTTQEMQKELASLKEVIKELIPIVERMQSALESGESICYDNVHDLVEAQQCFEIIERVKTLLR